MTEARPARGRLTDVTCRVIGDCVTQCAEGGQFRAEKRLNQHTVPSF